MRDPGKKADLGDIMLIARIHALIGTTEFHDCPAIIEIPAYQKLPFGKLTPNQSLMILDEAREELDELSQLLS